MHVISLFSKRLKDLRKERNINQEQLAKEIGASRGSISFYEKGSRMPDISTLDKLASYFNVSTDYLLGRTDEQMSNIEIQSIQNMTGLSSKAVNKLKLIKEKNTMLFDNVLYAINYLIGEDLIVENNLLGGTLLDIGEYLFDEFLIPSPSVLEKIENNLEFTGDELTENASKTIYYLTKSKGTICVNKISASSMQAIKLNEIQHNLVETRKKILRGKPYGDLPETGM